MRKTLLTALFLLGSTIAATAAYTCNPNSNEVNVRSGPSAQTYPVIDVLDNAYNVNIIDSTYNAAGYRWVKVRYNSLRYGHHSVETGWVDAGNVCN